MTPEILKEIHKNVNLAISGGFDQISCACCDKFHSKKESKKQSLKKVDRIITALQTRCKHGGDLHPELEKQYSVNHPLLVDILLSPRGYIKEGEVSWLQICLPCYKSLKKKNNVKPPKFAIANGYAIGVLPESITRVATPIEYRLVSPCTLSAMRIVVTPGPHGTLKGHCILYDNGVISAASKLPQLFNELDQENVGNFHVVFASSLEDRKRLLSLNKQMVKYPTLLCLLDTFRAWNPTVFGPTNIDQERIEHYHEGLPNDMILVADYDSYVGQEKESEGPATTRVL